MAQYIQTATKAQQSVTELLALIPAESQPAAACLIARVFNAGFLCNPRAARATIRETAVRTAMRNAPVKCRLVERPKDNGPGTYNALVTEPVHETADVA
jgi:hypothetical protein